MKHKHADVIKAWADGAEIEIYNSNSCKWQGTTTPRWIDDFKYRVKPTPKPDVVHRVSVGNDITGDWYFDEKRPNLKLTFDGETRKLKAAEVIE